MKIHLWFMLGIVVLLVGCGGDVEVLSNPVASGAQQAQAPPVIAEEVLEPTEEPINLTALAENETKNKKDHTKEAEVDRKRKYQYLLDLDTITYERCNDIEDEFLDQDRETRRRIRKLEDQEENLKEDIDRQTERVEIARNLVESEDSERNKRTLEREQDEFEELRDELKETKEEHLEKQIYLRQVLSTITAIQNECDRLELKSHRPAALGSARLVKE